MPNKNYVSGRAFEYRVKRYLEKKGYYVLRTAGSKSAFDLVAIPMLDKVPFLVVPDVLFIQCKHGQSVTKKTKDKIKYWAEMLPKGTSCTIAYSKPHGKIKFIRWIVVLDNQQYGWTNAYWLE